MANSHSPDIFAEIVAGFSTAMSPRYLAMVVLIAAGIAMFNKASPWLIAYVPASLILAQAITTVLKYTINRPRPPVQEQLVYTYDPSFPSGHSSVAFAIATAVIVLLATKTWRAKYPWAVAIVAVVGASASAASRLYLGVHWLSDVIAGTGIGIAAALSVWAAGSYVYRRRPRVR